MSSKLYFSLLGNPNCGKTSIFNLLTGLDHKVSNYPGITVQRKVADIQINAKTKISLEDYPGTYSLMPQSIDEEIVCRRIHQWIRKPDTKPSSILYVADVTNLKRNLFFLTELLPLDIPIILLLNMTDIPSSNVVDCELLRKKLNIFKVIPFSATKKIGLNSLKSAMASFSSKMKIEHNYMPLSEENKKIVKPLSKTISEFYSSLNAINDQISFSLLCNKKIASYLDLEQKKIDAILLSRSEIIEKFDKDMLPHLKTMDSDLRYAFINEVLYSANFLDSKGLNNISASEKIDKLLTHSLLGPIIYVFILYFIFQSIFTWAATPMEYIDTAVGSFGSFVYSFLPDSLIRDLIVDGIIAGFGAIVIFLPQILLLMFFMTLLEDTGYMTRVAFIMDKYMRKTGLHGKSILPIMSGYACAIPGIMSTRTIDSWKERLTTILILPLISCSARLPVYVLMIGAFIPDVKIYNFIDLQGMIMVAMYFLGTITAFFLAKIFSNFLSERSNPSFILELPPYRRPIPKSVLKQVYNKGKLFLKDAGKIIMFISIMLWFLASFPKNDNQDFKIENSYAGRIGKFVEPAIEPLGFDWKIGISLITSFAAREVVVSTLSTIYNIKDDESGLVDLKQAMRNDINPKTGKSVYTPLIALSIMIFYVYAAQCMATFAVVRTETNTWKWPLFMILYMTSLAYLMSFVVFQVGTLMGFN